MRMQPYGYLVQEGAMGDTPTDVTGWRMKGSRVSTHGITCWTIRIGLFLIPFK